MQIAISKELNKWLTTQACFEVVIGFMGHFDLREWQKMEDFITPEIIWERPDQTIAGILNLRKVLQSTPHNVRVRHVISNLKSTFLENGNVQITSYFTVYRILNIKEGDVGPFELNGPVSMGMYFDELTQIQNSWRIFKKQTKLDFRK